MQYDVKDDVVGDRPDRKAPSRDLSSERPKRITERTAGG